MLSSRFHRVRIAQIEQQMHVLENQMSLLRAEKETIEDDLATIVYPILTLPHEITSKIFVHYVDDRWRHSPLELRAVCNSWRQVALSTCWLYTRITSRHVDHLAAWLPLSGDLPLTLDFNSYYPSSSSEFRMLCQLLSDYSARWQSLTLTTIHGGVMPVHLPGTFSSLETVYFNSFCWASSEAVTIPMLHAPRLGALQLDCGRLMSQWHTVLPWPQLTKLDVNKGLEQWWQILPHTPNLEALRITDGFRNGIPENQFQFMPMIVLPHLRTLEFQFIDCCDMFEHLTSPALQNLIIPVTSDWKWDLMEPFVARSRCTIRNVELRISQEEDEDVVVRFFEEFRLSSVRQLTIIAPTKDTLLLVVNTLCDDDHLIPMLETLRIVDFQFQAPLIPIADMLSARSQRVLTEDESKTMANLKSFELTFSSEVLSSRDDSELHDDLGVQLDQALETLCHLQSKGLRVDIQTTFDRMGSAIDLDMIKRIRADGDSFKT
ncbi:hypothetical protein FB45DRAFT_898208 [Roridomyces roridus]|uniref:F-box domain-containing protein n=1 Tax=Roridomyces roridus TaxID=1738132 RepID=A0AAD7CC36_9AGAR|nr:hypothetical protein FB45DRAFT_898208 [Roridomyces roridus]